MVLVVRNAFYMGEARRGGGGGGGGGEATAARAAAPRRRRGARAAGISDAFIGQLSLKTTNDH